jgi:hypothetical protein
MRITRRTQLILLLLGLVLLLGFLFRVFILENFVKPVALVFWLIWRVLLSIDQGVYWSLLILLAVFYAFIHFARGWVSTKPTPPLDSNLTLETVDYWRMFIRLSVREKARVSVLKQNLEEMLVTMYTSRQPETPHWEVSEALRQRQIPLPESIYAFLFPRKPLSSRRSLRQVLHAIREAFREWARRRTGQDVAEYYRSIEEVLNFMETSMEISHDNEHFDTHAR